MRVVLCSDICVVDVLTSSSVSSSSEERSPDNSLLSFLSFSLVSSANHLSNFS